MPTASIIKHMLSTAYHASQEEGEFSRNVILMVGPSGQGKSSIVEQAAKTLGVRFKDFQLGCLDTPTDAYGFPYIEENEKGRKVTKSTPPEWFPYEDDEQGGILFLDEVNRANALVRQAVLNIILHRKFGDDTLPDNWMIVCAMNPDTDDYEVGELDTAVIDRVCVIKYELSIEDFREYAEFREFSLPIMRAIQKPEFVELFSETDINIAINATPRAYEFCNIFLDSVQSGKNKHWESITESLLRETIMVGIFQGYLGAAAGLNLWNEVKAADDMPSPEDYMYHYADDETIRGKVCDNIQSQTSDIRKIQESLTRLVVCVERDRKVLEIPEVMRNLEALKTDIATVNPTIDRVLSRIFSDLFAPEAEAEETVDN